MGPARFHCATLLINDNVMVVSIGSFSSELYFWCNKLNHIASEKGHFWFWNDFCTESGFIVHSGTQRKKLIHGNDPQKHQKNYTRTIWIFGYIFTTQSLKIMSFDDFWCRSTLKWLNFIKISFGEFSSISMVLYSRSNSFFVWTFFNPPFMSLFHEILTKKVNWKTKIKIGP